MVVEVHGNLEVALRTLSRQVILDGIYKQLKVHQIAKPSEKRRFKKHLAERRRLRNVGRKAWYREARYGGV